MPRYAAVDIGSNSIRLLVAECAPGGPLQTLAEDRQVTRLGESVFRSGRIAPEAFEMSCEVLSRMAKAYQKFEVLALRAVATSAVRDASNQEEFLARASQALGGSVEVISGAEEGRLIHVGVSARWPHPSKRILIMDVGGGSAELMVSEDGRLLESFSKPLGAVRLNEVFLKSDPPDSAELRHLNEYLAERLSGPFERVASRPLDRAIATSATAAATVCAINRVPRAERETADRLRASAAQIRKLYAILSTRSLAERRKIPGIGPRRAEIIVPGIALLRAVVDHLRLPALFYSRAGVRDGIVADLAARGVGRELAVLRPEQRRVIEVLARHYAVPMRHARRVAELARSLFHDLMDVHRLAPEFGKLLEAAAYVHEAGHYVSDIKHHKHSFYLVSNSDLPGFTERERTLIAHLCRYHRKALPAPPHFGFQSLPTEDRSAIEALIPLLRLADALDRSGRQVVERAACVLREDEVIVQLTAGEYPDLEIWASERLAELFRQRFSRRLSIRMAGPSTSAGLKPGHAV